MADSYFSTQDKEQKTKLTEIEAAQLQLHGHAITDKDGNPVTLPAQAILMEDEAKAVEKAQKKSESKSEKSSDKSKTTKSKAKKDDKKDADKDKADDKDAETKKAEKGVDAPTEDQSEHAPKAERGPANEGDIGTGYAPTGL